MPISLPSVATGLSASVGLVGVAALCWFWRVRSVRSKYRNNETKKLIPGSNKFPFMDYIIYGFTGRNMDAPFGDFEMSFTLGFPVLMVSEPSIVKELLKGGAVKDYDKGELTLSGVEVIAGRQNLFSLDGSEWQHMRLIIDPAFRPALMRLLTRTVVATVQRTMSSWQSIIASKSQQPQSLDNVYDHVSNMTLDVICQAAFGLDSRSTAESHPVMKSYKTLLNGLMMTMVGFGYFYKKSLKEAQQHIQDLAEDVLAQCRKKSSFNKGDTCLIELLLGTTTEATPVREPLALGTEQQQQPDATQQPQAKLTDKEIVDNIKIFLFAGHDSTASTTLWVLYLLALHPQYLEKIREELKGLDMEAGALLYEQIKTNLPFFQCFVKETLRLYPPAWAINRSPKKDVVLNGYTIPKGTSIMINTLRLHRREDLGWERPYEFIPERWEQSSTQSTASKSSFAYLPFGGGPRSCVGQPLAELEMTVSLALILQQFTPTFVCAESQRDMAEIKKCEIDYFAGATIRPKQIGKLRLVKR